MLARFLWPLQRVAGQRPLAMALLAAVALTLVATGARWDAAQRPSTGQLATVALVIAALAITGGSGPGLGALVAITLGVLLALTHAGTDVDQVTVLAALGASLLLPMLASLGQARDREQALHGAAHGAGPLVLGALAAGAGLVAIGWFHLLAPLAVTVVAGLLLPIGWLPTGASTAINPLAIAPRVPRLVLMPRLQGLVIILLLLGLLPLTIRVAGDTAGHERWWILLLPLVTAFVWHAASGSLRLAALTTATSLGWLGFAVLPQDALGVDRLLLAHGLAQPLPLALWLARTHQRTWPGFMLLVMGALPVLALTDAGLAIPTLGAALAGCLAGAAIRPRPVAVPAPTSAAPPSAGTALMLVHEACRRLEPYWRHYGTAKLRLDPVYRQLASDAKPWGRVLDAGCGPGLVAGLAAARHEPSYVGIDLDDDKLDAAVRLLAVLGRPLDANWQLLRARLPLDQDLPRRFDSAFLIDVLHYWPVEGQRALLTQVVEALDPGGRLWLRDGCADSSGTGVVGFGERFTTLFGLNPGSEGLHFLDEAGMRALLEGCGMRVDTIEASGGANRLWCCTRVASATTTTTTTEPPTAE